MSNFVDIGGQNCVSGQFWPTSFLVGSYTISDCKIVVNCKTSSSKPSFNRLSSYIANT